MSETVFAADPTRLLIAAAAGIVLLLLLIIKFKFHPVLSLLISALLIGLGAGMPVPTLVNTVEKGAGETLQGIVLLIGLGSLFGGILEVSGGAPANVAVAVAKLGGHTAFIGKAGKDMHGEFLKSVLEKENVETEGMLLDEKYFTTLAFVNIDENGERTFSFARKPGADTRMEKEEIDVDILDKTHIFHVGSLSLTEQPARDTTHYAIRRAKEKGSIISYDPNYRASLWKDEETAKKQMRSLVPYVDIMKISDEETKLLTDKKSPEEATEILFRKGVKIVAVTLGSDGAYLYCKEGGVHIPGFVSKAVDTNGAGDSFWGGFLYCISKAGKRPEAFTMDELKEYVRFGNAVASLCVERKGAIPAMPELAQVEERMGR